MLDPAIMADLRWRYADPSRAWHDWDRVATLLGMAEDLSHAIGERAPFILAILFHAAVFDRRRHDWDAASVALMRAKVGWPAPLLDRAEALVLAMARGELPSARDPSLRGDAALLLDMDNAVLGEAPAAFEAHEAAWRREYGHLKDEAYAAGRTAALEMLLWRDRVYWTDRFHLEREKRARRNIEGLIERLRHW